MTDAARPLSAYGGWAAATTANSAFGRAYRRAARREAAAIAAALASSPMTSVSGCSAAALST